MHVKITFPDGRRADYKAGITGLEIAKDISEGLARNILAILVNGEIWDATRPITQDAAIRLLTWEDVEGKYTFWHSSAHLLAEALEALYPGIKLGIGPPIEQGFYYDVDFGDHTFDTADLLKVEAKMKEIASQKHVYMRKSVSKEKAIEYFNKKKDPYKLELIRDLKDGDITFYTQGNFIDLCRGPHLPNTGVIKAIKLLNVAGAYWRGNEKNKQLTRIYGITFPKQSELTKYLERLEEAKKRDHRKLGKALKLFTFSERVGLGLPLWLPKGTALREELEKFLRNAQKKLGYTPVVTPHIGHKDLYITSGHYEKYGEDAFQPIQTPQEGEEFFLKPMNCPHHCEIYQSEPRSYRELPIRFAEFGTVYRYEKHGELHGLTRTRGFTQDDAHIFCTPEQVKDEIKSVIKLVLYIFKTLGFNQYTAQLSLHDPMKKDKYIGLASVWKKSEQDLREAAIEEGLPYVEVVGEAAFYGPKIDFMVKDALDRSWQLGTVQVDYQLPERFNLQYIGEDNKKHRPVMIHRAPFGSLERFIAILLEHTGGTLPFWLAPDQVGILPISEKYADYADYIASILSEHSLRSWIDHRDEKIGKKIRDAALKKIPYTVIVGEEEKNKGEVSVREHGIGDIGKMKLNPFINMLKKKVEQAYEYNNKKS